MKISYNWLKQFLKLEWDSQKTAELLTDLGLEVEGITTFESVKGGLRGVVVGHVLECRKHPNADRLKLTLVDIGAEQPVQIVCGAPNVAKGQKVPVATIGTTLYGKDGNAWKIKKGKIRGEESHGMICAEDELGLGDSHDGILVLSEPLVPGKPCSEVFEVENDEIFEIGLTPNRADAMSHFGVARDLKAGLEHQEIKKELVTPSTSNFSIDNRSLKIDVEVEDSLKAPRYCGLTISNVIVQDSPDWLKNRLKAIGLTPKNNVVDITNYVLHELGQPLHAFDASKIKGNRVEVKTLPKGTKFTTLDDIERELHEDDLMICDSEKPMCIAGIFGGSNSGVTSETSSIFLESAYFDPICIRKTAKRQGLNTDASFRFERGIDINLTEYALKRAALLIKEIAGGDISSEIVDLYPKKKEENQVFLSFDKINALIGQEIPRDTVKSILTSLEIKVNNVTETGLGMTIPSYRVDVLRDVDVIEEILRIYGYNTIGFKEKLDSAIIRTSKFENHRIQNIIADVLTANGFYEILTNSLVADEDATAEDTAIEMLNPLSKDLSRLRNTMLPSGLQAIAHNSNRQNQNLKFFEYGKTYQKEGTTYEEKQHLAMFITGQKHDDNWLSEKKVSGFFFLKGIVRVILQRCGIAHFEVETLLSDRIFSEALDYSVGERNLVRFGVINQNISNGHEIKQQVLYADFDWNNILYTLSKEAIVFKEIPRFPEVKRDLALLLNEHTTFKEVHDLAKKTEKKLLKKLNLFDVYRGKNLPKNKKSYAISYTLLDTKKTLTDKQIDGIMQRLQNVYQKELNAEIR